MSARVKLGWIVLLMSVVAGIGPVPAAEVDEARRAYDEMVKEATEEADAYLKEKQEAVQEAMESSQTGRDAGLEKRIAEERQRITEEMDTVRQRGLGPNYTQGMKENQLDQLQKRLDRLNDDPGAYFEEIGN
ncbi:MAG TPA: hypothetical protein VLT88_05180 [Desulfosarcina sp.]|nr:hypothetical protein [Desulfosarcina sp.]